MRKAISVLAVLGLLLGLIAAPASATQNPQNFVVALKAEAVTAADLAAIEAAGGTVVGTLPAIGVVQVTATNPGAFLKAMVKSGVVESVGPALELSLNLPAAADELLANDGTSPTNPADPSTYTWGVMLADGSLYASDMLSGLWQVAVDP